LAVKGLNLLTWPRKRAFFHVANAPPTGVVVVVGSDAGFADEFVVHVQSKRDVGLPRIAGKEGIVAEGR
jgi:hypothetical protein